MGVRLRHSQLRVRRTPFVFFFFFFREVSTYTESQIEVLKQTEAKHSPLLLFSQGSALGTRLKRNPLFESVVRRWPLGDWELYCRQIKEKFKSLREQRHSRGEKVGA